LGKETDDMSLRKHLTVGFALVTLACVILFLGRAYLSPTSTATSPRSNSSATVTIEDDRIVFYGEPLAHVVERFVALSGRKVTVSPEVAALVVGGEFKKKDFDQFLSMLPRILPVRVERTSDGHTRIVTAKATQQAPKN
jgi:ferric-dicitrate binding protein FerR (iron transport regulator)